MAASRLLSLHYDVRTAFLHAGDAGTAFSSAGRAVAGLKGRQSEIGSRRL